MRYPNIWIVAVCGLLTVVAPPAHGDLTVSNTDYSRENLVVPSIGASTATNVSGGAYIIAGFGSGSGERAIVPFLRTDFAAVAGQSITSAQLNFDVISDLMEAGESASIDVLLFSTSETDLTFANRNVYAGLTGTGGSHTVIGSIVLSDGDVGPKSVSFNAGGLAALQSAISGTDATIGISFREFAPSGDFLDLFAFGAPSSPGMTIDVVAIPAPGAAVLCMLGMSAVGWIKRRTQ